MISDVESDTAELRIAESRPGTVQDHHLQHIALRIQGQLSGYLRDFRLSRRDHGVILEGRACSYYGKQLAQHSVARATTLPIVANEIVVG